MLKKEINNNHTQTDLNKAKERFQGLVTSPFGEQTEEQENEPSLEQTIAKQLEQLLNRKLEIEINNKKEQFTWKEVINHKDFQTALLKEIQTDAEKAVVNKWSTNARWFISTLNSILTTPELLPLKPLLQNIQVEDLKGSEQIILNKDFQTGLFEEIQTDAEKAIVNKGGGNAQWLILTLTSLINLIKHYKQETTKQAFAKARQPEKQDIEPILPQRNF